MQYSFSKTVSLATIAVIAILAILSLSPHKAFAAAPLVLANATSTSNNASTTLAKVGNTISFQFNASGNVWTAPQISILNMGTTTMTGSNAAWTYSTTTTSGWTDGSVTFFISFGNTDGSATTTFASSASTTLQHVRFDKTAPTLSTVTVSSNNASTTLAKAGDVITLNATSNEGISSAAITIGGNTAAFTNLSASTTWKGTYTVQAGDTNGNQAINVAFTDYAGNAGTAVTTVTSGSLVYTDTTAPVITLLGSNPDSSSFDIFGSYADPSGTATDNHDGSVSVSGSGTVNRASVGTYTRTYTATDAAGNTSTATRTVNVTSGGSAGSGGGGGGGGGGGSTSGTPTGTVIPTKMTTIPASGTIASLQAQLKALMAKIAAMGGGAMPAASVSVSASAGDGSFTRTLTVGSNGADVKALQAYLNSHGYPVAATGPGSAGNETTLFGLATKAALMKMQTAAGISAIGVFGPMTRAYISSHQ